jgi:hypothetical protein
MLAFCKGDVPILRYSLKVQVLSTSLSTVISIVYLYRLAALKAHIWVRYEEEYVARIALCSVAVFCCEGM